MPKCQPHVFRLGGEGGGGAINPFLPNALFFYPLKLSENRKVLRVHWEQVG